MNFKLKSDVYAQIQQQIKDGYIQTRRHPTLPLTIYKYTRKAESDHYWPREVQLCRGLVLDDERNIIILPPPKFFNYTEKEAPLIEDPHDWECLEKLDGYYIAIKEDKRYGLVITSSGAFDNKYTWAARKLFARERLVEGVSYFCELCQNFPEDVGIIVAEHKIPRLVCWSLRPTTVGDEEDVLKVSTKPFPTVANIGYERLHEYLQETVEGVVLYNPSTHERIKMKTQWWFDVHAEIGFCTLRRIFEIMKSGQTPSCDKSFTWYQLEDTKKERPRFWDGTRLPDELRPLVSEWTAKVQETIQHITLKAHDYAETWKGKSDKELANNPVIPPFYRTMILFERHGKDSTVLLWRHAEHLLFQQK